MVNERDLPWAEAKPATALNAAERIGVMFEEYRALYGLLSFRLAAVDQHLPLVAGALMAVVSSIDALPPHPQIAALLAVPVAIAWWMRMTVAHARSKEDVLRRIDEIERLVNQLAGEELLAFQSRHPNRRSVVGGRTGISAVSSVFALSLAGLLGCLAAVMQRPALPPHLIAAYIAYIGLAVVDLVHVVNRLRRYGYAKAPPPPAAVSRVLRPSEDAFR